MGVGLVSPELRLVQVNPALCAMLGYREDELVGKSVFSFYPAEAEPLDPTVVDELLRGGVPSVSRELRVAKKSGEIITIALTAAVIRDERWRAPLRHGGAAGNHRS